MANENGIHPSTQPKKRKVIRIIFGILAIVMLIPLIGFMLFIGTYRYCYFDTQIDTAIMTDKELVTHVTEGDPVPAIVNREFYRNAKWCHSKTVLDKKRRKNVLILFRDGGARLLGRILEVNGLNYVIESADGQHNIVDDQIVAFD